MTRPQIILDIESTSLTPDYGNGSGVIWEVAALERGTGCEWLWRIEPDVTAADPKALEVGRFAERTAGMRHATREEIRGRYAGVIRMPDSLMTDLWDLTCEGGGLFWSDPGAVARVLARGVLRDVTLIGAVPSFDAGFLSALLAHHGEQPQPWHYRLRDIGSMAWAWLQAHRLPHHLDTPPMDAGTDDLARAMGVDPDGFERHSALGDVRLVGAMLQVIEFGDAR